MSSLGAALAMLMSTDAGGGGGSVLDTQTVTAGGTSVGSNPITNSAGYTSSLGSISDGTSNLYSGAAILELSTMEVGYVSPPIGYQQRFLTLKIAGTRANSGWTTMKVGSTYFNRADATFGTSGGNTAWIWQIPIPDPFTSAGYGPFTPNPTTVEFS